MSDALQPPRRRLAAPPTLNLANSVLLDFDGTLVDIVDSPDAVIVDDELLALIRRLNGTFKGRLALVSGRSVAQLGTFLGTGLCGVATIGSHGAEVECQNHRTTNVRPPVLLEAERVIRAAFGGRAGVIVEVKSLGVAIHFRMAPDVEAAARALVERLAQDPELAVQEGKMMLELRTSGHDKGTGIAALMAQPTFAATIPVFVGDDVTDETGFAAVSMLGGHGVLVGPDRPTAARYRLPDVASVRAWLGRAV